MATEPKEIPSPPDGFDSWVEWMIAHWMQMKGGKTWEDFNLERDCGKELASWRADERDAEKWRAFVARRDAEVMKDRELCKRVVNRWLITERLAQKNPVARKDDDNGN